MTTNDPEASRLKHSDTERNDPDGAAIAMARPARIFIIAGEHSGDALGAKLMEALTAQCGETGVTFEGVGGEAMVANGLKSLFPMEDVAVMGPAAILARLPNLVKRVYQTVNAAIAATPDVLVIIDSPEFTHPIAKRVRKRAPHIPIVNYVSPTVWAWRPGRSKKMKPYVDDILALLPFEPAIHKELGGPDCHYVGHPLIERKQWINELDLATFSDDHNINPDKKSLVILPGSRPNEVKHLMHPFGLAIRQLMEKTGPLTILLPTVNAVKDHVIEAAKTWPVAPVIILGEEEKFKAFKYADAALAASGTVTLELALTGTPMIVAYKYDFYLHLLRPLIKAQYFALANHILGKKAFPEFIQADCTPENIAVALAPLFNNASRERQNQLAELARIDQRMFAAGERPSHAAAARTLTSIKNAARAGLPTS